jgi:hypothetical protein
VLAHTKLAVTQAVAAVPVEPLVDPVAVPLVGLVRRNEELHFHLLELAHAEEEVTGGDLVAKRLPGLGDSERRLASRDLEDVLEVDEDSLRGLRPKEGTRALFLERADRRLEHQVELARLGQVALGRLTGPLARLAPAVRVLQLVRPEAQLAGTAVDQRVAEPADMAGRFPDLGMQDHRRVDCDDVVAVSHHRLEPARPDVVLHQDAVVAVVVRRAHAAVDLGGREDEPASAGERNDLVHRHRLAHRAGFRR